MAVIQDLVLTFCPTMHSVQQKKLKLLMPVYLRCHIRQRFSQGAPVLDHTIWSKLHNIE